MYAYHLRRVYRPDCVNCQVALRRSCNSITLITTFHNNNNFPFCCLAFFHSKQVERRPPLCCYTDDMSLWCCAYFQQLKHGKIRSLCTFSLRSTFFYSTTQELSAFTCCENWHSHRQASNCWQLQCGNHWQRCCLFEPLTSRITAAAARRQVL